jgi:hypothetical protein
MDQYNQPNSAMQNEMNIVDIYQVIYKMTKDMKFIGIFAIIYGALNCLSIVGAAVGVPMIFVGIRMKDSAEAFLAYCNMKDINILHQALFLQAKYMRTLKILGIISICLTVLIIIFYVMFFAFFMSQVVKPGAFTSL